MYTSEEVCCILNKFEALAQAPSWVVVMPKCMRHSDIALHRHLISCVFQQPTIVFALVPLKVELCRDYVGSRQIIEARSQHWCHNPCVQNSLLFICRLSADETYERVYE